MRCEGDCAFSDSTALAVCFTDEDGISGDAFVPETTTCAALVPGCGTGPLPSGPSSFLRSTGLLTGSSSFSESEDENSSVWSSYTPLKSVEGDDGESVTIMGIGVLSEVSTESCSGFKITGTSECNGEGRLISLAAITDLAAFASFC